MTEQTRPHDVWQAGTRWRVVKDGAKLSGLVSGGTHWNGWRENLAVGDVIECVGVQRGWGSDPVPEAHFSTEASREAGAGWVHFVPDKGMWAAWPEDGYLEAVEEVAGC